MTNSTSQKNHTAEIEISSDSWRECVRARALTRIPPARTSRALVGSAIGIALLFHLIIAVYLHWLMQPMPVDDNDYMEVRLLDAEPPIPPPPEPPQRTQTPANHAAISPAREKQQPQTTTVSPPEETQSLPVSTPHQWFLPDGSVKLVPSPASSPHEQGLKRGQELMQRGHNILHCAQNAFDPRPTAGEQANKARQSQKMLGLMFSRPWDNPTEYAAQIQANTNSAGDETISSREVAEQSCDDTFFHQPVKKSEPNND